MKKTTTTRAMNFSQFFKRVTGAYPRYVVSDTIDENIADIERRVRLLGKSMRLRRIQRSEPDDR